MADGQLAAGSSNTEKANGKAVLVGEKTGMQSRNIAGLSGIPTVMTGHRGDVTPGRLLKGWSFGGGSAGMPEAPDGTYETYREINTDPTVCIARAVVHGPILASPWSVSKLNNDVPDEWRDLIAFAVEPLLISLKTQMLRGLDFGCRSFEQVYAAFNFEGNQRIGIKKVKPLRPESTEVLVEQSTGSYAGLRNSNVDLLPEQTLHFAYDVEDDNWYGRSRHENIRKNAWWPYQYAVSNMGKLQRKVSNIIPIVQGPITEEESTSDGTTVSGFQAGMTLLEGLINGDGVVMESLLTAVDDIKATPELIKATRWNIDSFDTGSSSQAVSPLIELLRYYDAQKMRGWLRPERTATEGQHGTKAEVAEQADVGLAEGEQLQILMCQIINWHMIDRLLVWNFGEVARGQVLLEPSPLIDEKQAVFRWLLQALIANPTIVDLIAAKLDIDAMADRLGIPRLDSANINPDDLTAAVNAALVAKQVPAGPPRVPPADGIQLSRRKRAARRKLQLTR